MSKSETAYSIIVENLTKKFDDFVAVDKITFNVKKGEIFGFLGANGAGKTTAMRMLIGVLEPTSGKGQVAGYDIFKNSRKLKNHIGYMSQKFSLYDDLTAKENMRFFGGIYGLTNKEIRNRTKELLTHFGMEHIEKERVSSLPLGWKQKLAFCTALMHKPDVIFLDEPTSGVDPAIRRQFWEMIYETAEGGVTVLVTTHNMDEAEYCNRISMMVAGKMIKVDTPQNLKDEYKLETMGEVFLHLARGYEKEHAITAS